MKYLDRKKFFTLVVAGFGVLLVIAIFVISYLTNSTTQLPEPTPTATDAPIEQGVTPDPESGSDTMYDNDYSGDLIYTPLPKGFNPDVESTEGTVFDDAYVAATYDTLACQLSKKNTVTERAIEPLENFASDLRLSSSQQANATLSLTLNVLEKVEVYMGERLPANVADDIGIACYSGLDIHDDEDHTEEEN